MAYGAEARGQNPLAATSGDDRAMCQPVLTGGSGYRVAHRQAESHE